MLLFIFDYLLKTDKTITKIAHGGCDMGYNWEKNLELYISKDKVKDLCKLVDSKIRKGQMIKWSVIISYFLFTILLIFLIVILNILNKEINLRTSLINKIIAFELAIITFISPIKGSSITMDEINKIVQKQVTRDITEKICKTVEQKASRIEKWLAVISASGIFLGVILENVI